LGFTFGLTGGLCSSDKGGMRLFWLALLNAVTLEAAADLTIRVESGAHAAENAIVTFPLSDSDLSPDLRKAGMLRSASGESLPFQRNSFGEIAFVVPKMERHTSKTYTLQAGDQAGEAVRAELDDGRVRMVDGGKKVFTYQGAESALPRTDIKPVFKRGGYIHPLYSPAGRLVTDDYPRNHVHHHGIWFPWTKTEFEGRKPDFWNMGEGTGKVEFAKFGERWSGAVHAGFQAEHRFVDLSPGAPRVALEETWTVTAYHIPGAEYFVFDLVSTQSCASASPLKLPKYYYGGLGFRGNWTWNGAKNTEVLTSNGETNRVQANETRANWCHIGGEVEGQFAGVTIMSHPENFRAPQPMRIHPTEPFFCFAPSQLGDWQIEPGKLYVSRYRFVVSDGRPDRGKIERIWKGYAQPPKVVVEKR
jgi:hypothetical protein